MSEYPSPASQLLWKFIATENQNRTIWWRWEIWTQGGHYVTSSERQYETLLECELNAKGNGYVEPERRR
ncbi:MAG: hypothetical protein V7640_3121 [Betaproteobacteria bacterium]